jgi:membrane protein
MKRRNSSKFKSFLPIYLILETYKSWRDDRTLRLGAGIAYYGVFAIVPIVTLMVGVAAYFFSTDSIQSYITNSLQNILGDQFSNALSQFVTNLKLDEAGDAVATANIIGVVALFISASFIFIALQDALDAIWHIPIRRGWKKWIGRYLISYCVVMITSLLLFAGLLVNTFSTLAESIIPGKFDVFENFADFVFSMGSVAVGALILTLIFKLLIYQKVSWTILILSSFITTLMIIVGTVLLGYYLSNFASSSFSGAVGALLLVMVWVYYEAQIVLVGGQFIKVLHQNEKRLPAIMRIY